MLRPALLALALLCALPARAGDITVSAAASLTEAFREIGRSYEGSHRGVHLAFNFGASGALMQQIVKGAPVDVFAAADQESMDGAARQGLVRTRANFAGNRLVVVVPPSGRIDKLADLAGATRIAIGNPASVPVGRYAREALQAARLWEALEAKFIQTQNVRQALDYVARGEVDAGFVYATDVPLARVRQAFEVPMAKPISYPIATVSANPEAQQFLAYVLSPAGQAILQSFGFAKP
ncbi:MAG: molybdate ABC transporter substrate-binding protein [Pseudomonadota bacterium]